MAFGVQVAQVMLFTDQSNICDPSVIVVINKSLYVDDFLQSVDDISHGI